MTTVALDPGARAFLDMTADNPPLDQVPVEQSRADIRQIVPLTGQAAPLPEVVDATLPGPHGDVPVRVYRPALVDDLPVTAYFHGGGWVLGDLDTHDTTCRDLAGSSGGVVVAVHYRRAPEAVFPAALDDCLAVVRALLDGSAGTRTDPHRVAVAGDSAGGNLAAVVAQQLRGQAGLVHQALVYPVADVRVGATASYREFGEGHFLTQRDMQFFVDAYAGGVDPADPRVSPLAERDLSGLAPATVLTAEADPLRDEGEAYAAGLQAAGVSVARRRFAGQVHPFVLLAGLVPAASEARTWLGGQLAQAFGAGPG